MSDELQIPDPACRGFVDARDKAERDGSALTAHIFGLRAAAPHIVAAELRRLADWHWGTSSDGDDLCEALQARAAELEAGAS